MKDPIAALEWHPGPGAEELVRRKAQLQVLTRGLLERERGLAAYRNELAAFECEFSADAFSLYVHDAVAGWQATRQFALQPTT